MVTFLRLDGAEDAVSDETKKVLSSYIMKTKSPWLLTLIMAKMMLEIGFYAI